MKIILIMGLSGSGKTTLAEELAPLINANKVIFLLLLKLTFQL